LEEHVSDLVIDVENLVKRFGALTIINGASFQLFRQEVVVICGPSGSGKSTFIRCINGLESNDGGVIRFNGTVIDRKNGRDIRKRIGMVFQSYNLFSHLSVQENAMLAPVKVLKRPRKAVQEEVEALFEMVGLADKMRSHPHQLSGGQQQRAAIVRALAMKPEVMLFDEPTSALDPEMIKGVLDVMKTLAVKGMTMIVVSHEMGFAREVADRIAFFCDGQFAEVKSPKDFFSNPEREETRRFLAQILHT
jgi:polar amino acid transport system ATP-binding protein